MDKLVIILVIISALIHSIWNLFAKKSRNKLVFNWYILLLGPILCFPILLYFVFTEQIPAIAWLFITLSGFFIMFYFYFLGKSYYDGNLSLAYPIARSSTLFVPFLAVIIIKEKIALTGIFGIILILIGIYLLHLRSFKLSSFLRPLKYVKEKTTIFAILTALFSAFYQVNDKMGVEFVSPFLYIGLAWLIASILYTPFILTKKNRKDIKIEWATNKKSILISAFFNIFSYALILFTFTIGKVSYIVALRQISIVFGVILGVTILKERYGRIRLIASIVIFAGLFLVAIA